MLLAVGGITLMSYSEGFGAAKAHGIVFVVLSAFGSALYQVNYEDYFTLSSADMVQ